MEKLLKKLSVLYDSVQMLFLMENISRRVRDHMVAIIEDVKSQLRQINDSDFEAKLESYSQSEKFVNEHINLADTIRILHELQRRNVDWNEKDCDEDDSSRLRGSVIGDNSRIPSGL